VSDRIEVKTPTWTATLIKRQDRHGQRKQYYSQSRVYGAVDTFAPDEFKAYDDAVLADPNTNHRSLRRAATSKAREGLLKALDELVPRLDVNFRDLTTGTVSPSAGTFKVKFSGKAGCSCPCSPGFIIDGDTLRVDGVSVDVWFEVTKPEVEITKKDLAQAVFYGLTELDAIKLELGV
jgi:hypothetical protein